MLILMPAPDCLLWFACVIALLASSRGQSFAEMNGDDIVASMQTMSDKCPEKAANGQNWAPIPKGTKCGSVDRCDFPNQWCTYKAGSDGAPDLKSLNCQAISDLCKQAFKDNLGASGGTTTSGASTTTSGTTATSTKGSTTGSTTTGSTTTGSTTTGSTTTGSTTTGSTTTGSTTTEGSTTTTEATNTTTAETTTAEAENTSTAAETTSTAAETTSTAAETTSTAAETTSTAAETTSTAAETTSTAAETTTVPSEKETTIGEAAASEASVAPTASAAECCDYHEFCCFWASEGQCDHNRKFMARICQKSCGTCGCEGTGAQCTSSPDPKCSGSDVPPGKACPCTVSHPVHRDWNPKCSMWAMGNGCDSNPDYMKAMCKVSCNVCT